MISSDPQKAQRLKSRLVKAASGTAFLRGLNVVFNMLTSVLLARLLGVEGYGTYSYAMIILQFLVVIASLGLPQVIVRETAINQTKGDWGLIKGLQRWTTKIVLSISIGLTIMAALSPWALKGYLGWEVAITLLLALLILPMHTFLRMQEATLRGLFYVIRAQIPMQVIRPGLFFLLLLYYLFLGEMLSALEAMAFHVLAFGSGLIFGFFLLKRLVPFRGAAPVFAAGAC